MLPLIALLLGGDVVGTVTDSATGAPLPSVEVTVQQGTAVLANTSTDPFGRYVIHNVAAGSYTVAAHFIGFVAETRSVTIDNATLRVDFKLIAAPPQLEKVQVSSKAPVTVDTRSGDQTYSQNESHSAPTTTTSGILQQAMAGAARAPTGEVHIRGQHAEYQYYVDGVPVPSGVSGSLNELFDPSVVQSIDFQTGAWDAEYGGKNVAVINIQTRVPAGGFHGEEATYGGSYGALGQSLSMSGNDGPIGAFVSGTAQGSDMRLEPVMGNSANAPVNFHNAGQDYFGFGKLQYSGGAHDLLSLDGNYSKTHFDIPYDSTGGAVLNDHQTDVNAFVNLSYRHRFGGDSSAELFVGPFYRHGSLNYRPGSNDSPTFVDAADPTQTPRNVSENRSFNTVGIKTDLEIPIIADVVEGKIGTLYSHTSGNENFELIDPTGVHGPIQSISNLNGYDWGSYAQVSVKPLEWVELRAGVRFDSHVAPFAGNQTQWSPRIRLNFFPDPWNTIYFYFGRQFIPTNIEDLRSITKAGDSNVVTTPTLPERDAFYEGGYIHRFPLGFVNKAAVYHKVSTPGIDDNTVPGSQITTDVNIAEVQVVGVEDALEWQPAGPFSGYVNFAINHAYGRGPISGGFFPIQTPNYTFDLDHDQRVSVVANLTYSAHAFYVTASGIYGSGLTNGLTPDGTNPDDVKAYGTCLFCFNSKFKVHPNYVQNLSLGYTLFAQRTYVRPEVFFTNLFNAQYILKGAFFSGASIGRPFTVNFRLTIGV
ncbi:MAG TPA: TonB-dependent receptor [Gemmatimonadaceae bacterium]|nr:TonB-dependent receptor [Gemmatimonadaceae bacterium]